MVDMEKLTDAQRELRDQLACGVCSPSGVVPDFDRAFVRAVAGGRAPVMIREDGQLLLARDDQRYHDLAVAVGLEPQAVVEAAFAVQQEAGYATLDTEILALIRAVWPKYAAALSSDPELHSQQIDLTPFVVQLARVVVQDSCRGFLTLPDELRIISSSGRIRGRVCCVLRRVEGTKVSAVHRSLLDDIMRALEAQVLHW